MPCYSTHSKYLPARKPHCWQARADEEPSNLFDYSWFLFHDSHYKDSPLASRLDEENQDSSALCCKCNRTHVMGLEPYNEITWSVSVRWTHWHQKGSNRVGELRHVASLLASLCTIMLFSYMRLLSCTERDIGVPFPRYWDLVSIRISLNLEVRSFSYNNTSSNFKPGLVHCFPHSTLQPHQKYPSLALSENTVPYIWI